MIAGGLASEVLMIYCYASLDNWQMEKTRCRARGGGKLLFIRTPLTSQLTRRGLILCYLLQKSCAGFGRLSRGCGDLWRDSLPSAAWGAQGPWLVLWCPGVTCPAGKLFFRCRGAIACLHGNKTLETAIVFLTDLGCNTAGTQIWPW